MARKQVKSVSGMVVAITGGARGIGKATTAALVRRGARVAIGDLDEKLAEQTANELGGNVVALPLDVTDRSSFERFLDGAEKELGPVDVVVNNASQAGKAGFPGGATYCATKHAVVGLSEAARAELRDSNVEVSVVMPAVVNTELGSGLMQARGVKTLEPEDVAEAIVEAVETNRFEVWVPKETQAIATFMTVIPRRGREAVARLLKADKILAEPDKSTRASYEDRAAHSTAETTGVTEVEAKATETKVDPAPDPEASAKS